MIYNEIDINDIEHIDGDTLQDRITDYLASPNHCLHCDSDNISCGHFDASNNAAWSNVKCLDCSKEWTDCYTLTSVDLQ